jgi:hypothetical protein
MCNETVSREPVPEIVRRVCIALAAAAVKAPVSPLATVGGIGAEMMDMNPARLSRLEILRLLGTAVVCAAKATHSPPIEKHHPILGQSRSCGISTGETSDMGQNFKILSRKTSPRACLPG